MLQTAYLTITGYALSMNTNQQRRTDVTLVRHIKCLVQKLMHFLMWRLWRCRWWTTKWHPYHVSLILRGHTMSRSVWTSRYVFIIFLQISSWVCFRVCPWMGIFTTLVCQAFIGWLKYRTSIFNSLFPMKAWSSWISYTTEYDKQKFAICITRKKNSFAFI